DETPITASSSALRIRVPRAGLLHAILFRQERDNAAVDDIINTVTLQSDNTFNHADRLDWDQLRHRNTIEYQLETFNTGAATVPPNFSGVVGYAYLDVVEDGLMSSALNTLDLNLDVTLGGGAIRLVRMTHVFYEPIIVAAAP